MDTLVQLVKGKKSILSKTICEQLWNYFCLSFHIYILCLVDYFSVDTMLIGIVFYIVGKPVYLPFTNDVQLVRIMHLWDEQHSLLCG